MLLLISQFSLVIELFCLAKVVPAELCAGSDGSEEPLLILDEFPGGRGWKNMEIEQTNNGILWYFL